MMPDINTGKFADGTELTAEQKLVMKEIIVNLLSGERVIGRKVRLGTDG